MKRCCIFVIFTAIFTSLMLGCGGTATDDLEKQNRSNGINSNTKVTLIGYVNDGTLNSFRATSEMRYSLSDLSGITVFLENYPNLVTKPTDNTGRYEIYDVPQGRHTLIAEKREGTKITFRARKEDVAVLATQGNSAVELDSNQNIGMKSSPYSLNINITDTDNNRLTKIQNGLSVMLWGHDYASDNMSSNIINLKDFPDTLATATITANGYESLQIPLKFSESSNSDIYIQLPKTKYENIAPIVSINYKEDISTIYKDTNDVLTINPDRQLNLYATGLDQNGDSISFRWSATSGDLKVETNNSFATFVATSTYSNVTIILIGDDGKNGIGKAELLLKVYGGTTSTDTSSDTNTDTDTTSDTSTETSSDTATDTSSDTSTETSSDTATDTSSDTSTETSSDTATSTGTSTNTNTNTNTNTSIDVDYSDCLENPNNWEAGSGSSVSLTSIAEIPQAITSMLSEAETITTYDTDSAIWVDLEEESIIQYKDSVSDEIATINNNVLTINTAGTYILYGDFNGYISIPEEITDGVTLVLNSTKIIGQEHCAIYNAQKTTPLTIVINSGTRNILSDASSYKLDENEDEPSACLFSKGDLTICGSGTLIINANCDVENAESNGIQCKGNNGLFITGGTIEVTTNGGDAIKSKSNIGIVNDGHTITLTANGNGECLKTKGDIYLKNSSLILKAGGDLIKAENDWEEDETGNTTPEGSVYIDEGVTINGSAYGDGIQATDQLVISGGNITITTTNKTFYTDDSSSKGLKSGCDLASGSILIAGGNITLNTQDHAIKSKGTVNINGNPAITIDAPLVYRASGSTEDEGGKGISGTGNVTIEGNPTIRILNAEEGIESKTILTIAGGDIKINTWDDGMNVGGTGTDLNITGGTTYIYAKGDGIDSNGNITITGGTIIVNSDSTSDNSVIDFDGVLRYSGGTIIAAGPSGMDNNKQNSGSNNLLTINGNFTKGKLVNVQDDMGSNALIFTPAQNCTSIKLGSADLKTGTTYSAYVGGSTSSLNDSCGGGIFYTNGIYTPGVLVGSAQIVSNTTTIGQSGGQMGPGGQPGEGGNPPSSNPPNGENPPSGQPGDGGNPPNGNPPSNIK